MPPRRFTTLVFVTGILLTGVLIISSASRRIAANALQVVTPPESIRPKIPAFDVPGLHWSWHKSIHKPPEQKNSTSGDSSWYTDWTWLNPFSSSVTLDEDRVVLPPLPDRLPVYTYVETPVNSPKEVDEAETEILITWRRAWWAHGFQPVVLTQKEAIQHPLYQLFNAKGLPQALDAEFMRWLAWGHMGTGLFADYLCVPMSAYDNVLLAQLRHGQFEKLTRFEGFGSGLFAGDKSQINDAIKEALDDANLSKYKTVTDAIDHEKIKIETPTSFAYYSSEMVQTRYPVISQKTKENHAKGLLLLNQFINAHLHNTWQNIYSTGIAVLKPLPAHSTSLIRPSLDLARLLAECPESILVSSCPPNRPRCTPCVGSKLKITTPGAFKNISTLYTISVVPHPYTMITLNNLTNDISVAHIRRHTERDQWLSATTRDILGDGRGGPSRLVSLKDVVASEYSSSRSIWFTTEQFPTSFNPPPPPPKSPTNEVHPPVEKFAPFPEEWLADLDWHFGFSIPRTTVSHGESVSPVPGPERVSKEPAGIPSERRKSYDPTPPTDSQLATEVDLLRKARDTIKSKTKSVAQIKSVAEAWNLADTEAWKFVRAYRARAILERKAYMAEEAKYDGPGAGRGQGRWFGP